MTLTNRLAGDWTRLPPVVIDNDRLHGRQCALQDILSKLQDDLYCRGSHPHGLVILSPGLLETGTGYEAMVLEATAAEGRARAESLAKKLLAAMGTNVATRSRASLAQEFALGEGKGIKRPAYRVPGSPDG
jgi:hypothetical protein